MNFLFSMCVTLSLIKCLEIISNFSIDIILGLSIFIKFLILIFLLYNEKITLYVSLYLLLVLLVVYTVYSNL